MRVRLITKLLFMLLLVGVVPVGSQETVDEIPEDRILLLSGPTRYEVIQGRRFSVQVFLDRTEMDDIVVELPELPDGIEIDDVPILVSRSDGVVEARIEVTARRAGRFVINPIRIETTTGEWYVPRLLVEAAPAPGQRVPFGARWRLLQDTVFQGQSVPVVLEITGIDSFTYPDSIAVRPPQSGLFEEISGIGSVVSDSVAGVELFEIPVAVFLFTATAAGEVVLPAAQVDALGITATAPALPINVRDLPSMVESSGAVGRFMFDVQLDRSTLVPGETAQLTIRLEGEGNFPVLNLPPVTTSGLLTVDQSETGDSQPDTESLLGYQGERIRTIRLEPEEGAETAEVVVAGFSYYDPVNARVITLAPRTFSIEIPADTHVADLEREMPAATLLSVEELQHIRWYRILGIRWPLFAFLIGPAVFAVVRLFSVRRRPANQKKSLVAIVAASVLFTSFVLFPVLDTSRLEKANRLVEQGRYAVAGVLYDLEIQEHRNHAGLYYNRGILAMRADNVYATVFHLRRAARLAPGNAHFRDALEQALEYFSVTDQVPLPYAVRPDFFILVLLVLWTAFWSLLLARSALPRSISLVSLVMISIIVAGGLFWSVQVASQSEGIVRRDVIVRRIPDYSAEPWVQLNPVTTVQIELSYDEFYLVSTSSGVTGWVPQTAIRVFGANL